MKLIFSRKGFDAGAGGVASPILPSGEFCSLPIPEPLVQGRFCRYADIRIGQESVGKLVQDLGGRCKNQPLTANSVAHLDPDLNPQSILRLPGWQPIFGQAGAAEKHLQNQGVAAGDIFLFYGWFREVQHRNGRYCYVTHSPDRHILFGWLQIEQRLPVVDTIDRPLWTNYHPHCQMPAYHRLNCLYLATPQIKLPGISITAAGSGVFQQFHPRLTLTHPNATRSLWQLPDWFHPQGRRSMLSYHTRPDRWSRRGEYTCLQTVGRGQEFVLDCEDYPEAIEWVADLLQNTPVDCSTAPSAAAN